MEIGPLQIQGWEEALLAWAGPVSKDKGSEQWATGVPAPTGEAHGDVGGRMRTQRAWTPRTGHSRDLPCSPGKPTPPTPRFPASSLSTEPVDVCFKRGRWYQERSVEGGRRELGPTVLRAEW